MLRRVVLVRTDVSEECSASIIRVTKLDELGTTLAVISNRRTMRLNSENACYHSVQDLLSPPPLLENVKIRIYKTIILPVVLYGSETCYLILRKEHRLKMFKNRVSMRMFRPKRSEGTGGWRKLHNEKLHDRYSSLSIIIIIKSRKTRWTGHVTRIGQKRIVYRLLVGKLGGRDH
jgi:hypothetical protein